jgi:hypothetical protein
MGAGYICVDGDVLKWVWHELVPKEGQATSVQGELLRAVQVLRWEAEYNGNKSWDEGCEKLWRFLKTTLNSAGLPSHHLVKAAIARLGDHQDPLTDEETYNELLTGIVEYCVLNQRIIPRAHDPSLSR